MSAYLERLALRLVGTPVATVRPRLPARFEAMATSAAERPGQRGDGDSGPMSTTPADAPLGTGTGTGPFDAAGRLVGQTAAADDLPRRPGQPGVGDARLARASGRLDGDDRAATGVRITRATADTGAPVAATGDGPTPHHSDPAGGPAAAAPATARPDAPTAAAKHTSHLSPARSGERATRPRQAAAGMPNVSYEASFGTGLGQGAALPAAVADLATGALRGSGPSAAVGDSPVWAAPGHATVPSAASPPNTQGTPHSGAAPVVEVTIGSVELRLPASAASSRAPVLRPLPTAPAPRLSLRDYLRRRGEGSGGPAR